MWNTRGSHVGSMWLFRKGYRKSGVTTVLHVLVFNNSLSNGTFPSEFKSALIRPLLKRPNLDTGELKKYSPVSNFHFVAKVLETLVMIRLEEHMETHSLHDPMQSALKKTLHRNSIS